ncbi:MAG TPA: hypothetical protein VD994_08715, partial [Prosthecobacter sp.]|nr:hypothetical protein [Prosthecobacter sp.]
MLLLFAVATANGQTPLAKPDPLQWLLTEERPADKKFRLRVSLLRVPLQNAAEALLADNGETLYFWRARLTEWRKTGKLEEITIFGGDEEDMEEHSGPSARPYRFIGQVAAARFWQDLLETKEVDEPPPDMNRLLQELSEQPCGNSFKGVLNMRPGLQQALVKLSLLHCPEPEERPTTTWPLPTLRAPRYLFRPWSLSAATICPVNEPFLLGCQMEPPHDGQVDTSHLLMAFGRIVLPENTVRDLEGEQPRTEPIRQVQTWTLAVDSGLFLPWIAARHSAEADGAILATWLNLAATKAKVELAGTAALAVAPNERTEVTSALRWQDVTGFEPSGTDTEFRPIPCEEDVYYLEHGFRLDVRRAEAAAVNAWTLDLSLSRPAAATRWRKWKIAMEQTADAATAVEVAEADQNEPSQLLRTGMDVRSGQVTMAGASMKGNRVYVSFVRLTETAPPQIAAAAEPVPAFTPPRSMTLWGIETPEAWQQRLLGTDLAFSALAEDLVEAVQAGKEARVCSLSCQVPRDDLMSYNLAAEPRIFFGGNYVNTAPAPAGIFFNARHVGRV